MSLKFTLPSKSEIPAELQSHYVEREGSFVLDVDGAVEKSRLDELRNSNAALTREREEFKKRFEGIDPDEVRKLTEEKRKLEEAQQLKAGELEKVLEARVKSVRTDLEKQVRSLAEERDSLNSRLTTIQIDQGILAAATKRGLRPTALPDITARARTIFRLVNGVPTAFESDGQTVRAGKDRVSPMTLEEWIETQVSEAPHLFEPSSGGGAAVAHVGTPAGRGNPAKNPFRKDSWNLTEQMRLQRQDPNLAARLRASA
jgi:hypothetical protein